MLETLVANLVGRVRHVTKGGREYLVAPLTLIVPGVLNGSKGALYYPPEHVKRSAAAWNGTPLVVYHPTGPYGEHLSAGDPGVLDRQGVGFLQASSFDGKLRSEGWFDAERTKQVDPRVYQSLVQGKPIELSTGLFTDNEEAASGSVDPKGRPYTHIAKGYKPDHLAVLPDQVGACSINDGCGVLVNMETEQELTFNRLEHQMVRVFVEHPDLAEMLFNREMVTNWCNQYGGTTCKAGSPGDMANKAKAAAGGAVATKPTPAPKAKADAASKAAAKAKVDADKAQAKADAAKVKADAKAVSDKAKAEAKQKAAEAKVAAAKAKADAKAAADKAKQAAKAAAPVKVPVTEKKTDSSLPTASTSYAHAHLFGLMDEAIVNSGMSKKEADGHRASFAKALTSLTPKALAIIHQFGRVQEISLHKNPSDLTDDVRQDIGNPSFPLAVGCYDQTKGKLWLDGGIDKSGMSEVGIHAHELLHALDGDKFQFSHSDEFVSSWKEEMKKKQLNTYSATVPHEGMAELVRAKVEKGADATEKKFPKCVAYMKSQGIW